MHVKTIYGYGLMTDAELDAPHPSGTIRTSGWKNTPQGHFHIYGTRVCSVREAIELECQPDIRKRPSVKGNYDARSLHDKLADWLRMWVTAPFDALRLPFIDRYPPMVWWDYDDSDDWATKRWQRAVSTARRNQQLCS